MVAGASPLLCCVSGKPSKIGNKAEVLIDYLTHTDISGLVLSLYCLLPAKNVVSSAAVTSAAGVRIEKGLFQED